MSDVVYQVDDFAKVIRIVKEAKKRAYRKVNEELIIMYYDVGKCISEEASDAKYGDGYIERLADYFVKNSPELKGFNRAGLYRMKQFYEIYKNEEKMLSLLTQISWTNHLKIMSASKTMDERNF